MYQFMGVGHAALDNNMVTFPHNSSVPPSFLRTIHSWVNNNRLTSYKSACKSNYRMLLNIVSLALCPRVLTNYRLHDDSRRRASQTM